MIGAIIGAVGALGGGIASAIGNRRAEKAQQKYLRERWTRYNSRANRLSSESLADSETYQTVMSRTGEQLREQNREADARASTGALSQEQAAAQKEKNNRLLVDMQTPLIKEHEERRRANADALEREEEEIHKAGADLSAQRAKDRAAAASQFIGAAASVGSAVDGFMADKGTVAKAPSAATTATTGIPATTAHVAVAPSGDPLQEFRPKGYKKEADLIGNFYNYNS